MDGIASSALHPWTAKEVKARLENTKSSFITHMMQKQTGDVFHSAEDAARVFVDQNDDDGKNDITKDIKVLTFEMLAWRLYHSDESIFIKTYPPHLRAFEEFILSRKLFFLARRCLFLLVMISVFHLPTWCYTSKGTMWERAAASADHHHNISKKSTESSTMQDLLGMLVISGDDYHEYCDPDVRISGAPVLQPWFTLPLESLCFLIHILHGASKFLYLRNFKKEDRPFMWKTMDKPAIFIAIVGLCTSATLYYFLVFDIKHLAEASTYTFCKMSNVCVGLLLLSVDEIQGTLDCALGTYHKFLTIMLMWIATNCFMAWFTLALLFQGGYENPGKLDPGLKGGLPTASMSFFYFGSTGNFPDQLLPSYEKHRRVRSW